MYADVDFTGNPKFRSVSFVIVARPFQKKIPILLSARMTYNISAMYNMAN